jgi:hypothetical protein
MSVRLGLAASAAVFFLAPAHAQLRPMSDEEMSRTRGQGLLAISNSRLGGFDFTRIALDADVTMNASFRNMRLGDYRYTSREGLGADIDMPLLQFGGSGRSTVQITNPYFEFVYRAGNDASQPREVIGMRFGFDAISGDVGLKLNSLSGSMLVNGTAADGTPVKLDSHVDTGGGKRWDGSCTGACINFSQLANVRAGDAAGPSRDFWISVLKTGVQFQAPPGTTQLPDAAQAGIWMNWRDKLQALGVNLPAQTLPPAR